MHIDTLTDEQQATAAANYPIYRELLDKTVMGFVKRYGGDYDELRQDAELWYVRAHTYPPAPGLSMEQHIRGCVWYNLLDARRTAIRRAKRHSSQDAATAADKPEGAGYRVEQIQREIEGDAKTLLQLFVEAPAELAEVMTGRVSKRRCEAVRLAIQGYLRARGWSTTRINNSFAELREAVVS